MPAIVVRPMRAGDVPVACTILNEIISTGGTTAFEENVSEADFSPMYLHGPDFIACHAALDAEGKVAGFQWIGRNPTLPNDCADIATFTRRTFPLRGAGRALFPATQGVALAEGYAQINATIRADNLSGLGYYAKMGFVDHGVTPDVPLRDGTPVDRISKRFSLIGAARNPTPSFRDHLA